MSDPTLKIGALQPELAALADWLDKRRFPVAAEAVRDWHVARDGAWRPYAATLARLPEIAGPDAVAAMARLLLRSHRGIITHFFAYEHYERQAPSVASRSSSASTKSVSTA